MTTQETIAEVRRLDKLAAPGPMTVETVPTQIGACHKIGPLPKKRDRENYACIYADGHTIGVSDNDPGYRELRATADMFAFSCTAAPALADAVEKRDEVIDILAMKLRDAIRVAASSIGLTESAITRDMSAVLEGCGVVLADGKWRIAE